MTLDPRSVDPDLDPLLQPSLGQSGPSDPLYSVRAGYLTAFFGGVYATLVLNTLQSRKLGRLTTDAWLYGAIAMIWSAVLVGVAYAKATGTIPDWIETELGDFGRAFRWAGRLVALLVFGLVYLLHRSAYRAQLLLGEDWPSPWKASLSAIAASIGITILFAALGAILGVSAGAT